MTTHPPNGWSERARTIGWLVNNVGGTTLVLAFLLGMLSGWIPSPLTAIADDVKVHDQRVQALVLQRAETDRKLAAILEELTKEMRDRNRRDKLRECSEIKDRDVRDQCFR